MFSSLAEKDLWIIVKIGVPATLNRKALIASCACVCMRGHHKSLLKVVRGKNCHSSANMPVPLRSGNTLSLLKYTTCAPSRSSFRQTEIYTLATKQLNYGSWDRPTWDLWWTGKYTWHAVDYSNSVNSCAHLFTKTLDVLPMAHKGFWYYQLLCWQLSCSVYTGTCKLFVVVAWLQLLWLYRPCSIHYESLNICILWRFSVIQHRYIARADFGFEGPQLSNALTTRTPLAKSDGDETKTWFYGYRPWTFYSVQV